MDHALEAWLQHPCATQLPNLLRRLANRQVAGSRLAVLDLATRGESESLFRGLVSLLFGHWNTKAF